MIAGNDPHVCELDGPPQAYFEIPLDYWANSNGELEAAGQNGAVRLIQRIVYVNFDVASTFAAQELFQKVRVRLLELGGGYVWWRKRPTQEGLRVNFRLATTPQLPRAWWEKASKDVKNASSQPNFAALAP